MWAHTGSGLDSNCPIFQQSNQQSKRSTLRDSGLQLGGCCLYSRPHGPLDHLSAGLAGATKIWPEHGVCGVLYLGHAAAAGLGASGVRVGQAQPGAVLARCAGGNGRQHPGRRGHLGHGLGLARVGGQVQPVAQLPLGPGLAGPHRPQSLPAVLVAGCRRPAMRCGRLAAPAVLALPALHGDWQVFTLPADDGGTAVGVSVGGHSNDTWPPCHYAASKEHRDVADADAC